MIWFLHGNFGSPSDWRKVVNLLEKRGHECRTLNLWKYLECCPKSLAEMGALIASEIAAHDPAPYLCGYSLGGRLAIHALLHDPSLWKGLIFIGTHPGLASEGEREARRSSDAQWGVKCLEMPWAELLHDWDAQSVFFRGGYGVAGENMQSLAEGVVACFDMTPRGGSVNSQRRTLCHLYSETGITPSCRERNGEDPRLKLYPWRRSIARAFIDWSLGSQQDCRDALRGCRVPSLWIAGENDSKFAELARSIVGDHVHLVAGSGHRVPMEAPDSLAELIDSFTLPGCHAR